MPEGLEMLGALTQGLSLAPITPVAVHIRHNYSPGASDTLLYPPQALCMRANGGVWFFFKRKLNLKEKETL